MLSSTGPRPSARLPRALGVVLLVALASPPAPADGPPPQTGFEQRQGASWTTYDEELPFLAAVDARSERVEVDVIGRTAEGRAMHLVRIGYPRPLARADAARGLVELHMCTQHGNEPAGREACLQWLRDLAFTSDPTLIAQMRSQTILFVPTANPDGRDANIRGNSLGTDVNRDHLNVESREARAIAAVVRDWRPSFVMDHHEYGPGQPVLYDDDVLYLWPRNLNVDEPIREMGKSFSVEFLKPCLADGGYSSDEYGLQAVGDVDVEQTAGDHDEGIARNTAGLRHAIGILIESAVSPKATAPTEVIDGAENALRRVASQHLTIACTLEYMRENGAEVHHASVASRARKLALGASRTEPVYFNGQDEDTTLRGTREQPTSVADPPPCGYRLSAAQAKTVATAFGLHGIASAELAKDRIVSLAQTAEPVIPLLLDARAARHAVEGAPLDKCPAAKAGDGSDVLGERVLPETGVPASPAAGASVAFALAMLLALALTEPRRVK